MCHIVTGLSDDEISFTNGCVGCVYVSGMSSGAVESTGLSMNL